MEKYDVAHAKEVLIEKIVSYTNFRYLKSQDCLKARIKDFVFELNLYYDKYNTSYEYIGMQCDFNLWYRKYGKMCNVNTIVTSYPFRSDAGWFEITNSEQLEHVYTLLEKQILEPMMELFHQFQLDEKLAIQSLFEDYDAHSIALDVVADVLVWM